jgi:hypothetical protein
MAESFTKAFFFIQIYGKNISHSKGEQETEVLFESRSTLLPLRP